MPNTTDVLAALTGTLEPSEAQRILRQLLRVPEAWDALVHNPGQWTTDPAQWCPGSLAAESLGLPALQTSLLSDAQEEELETLLKEARARSVRPPNLRGAALLAISLLRQEEAHGASGVAQTALNAPSAWRSPLALAYPSFQEPSAVITGLCRAGSPGALLAVDMLLANTGPEEAAAILRTAVPDDLGALALDLLRHGESALAGILAADHPADQPKGQSSTSAESAHSRIDAALHSALAGSLDSAREELQAAWQEANEWRAQIADRLADVAQQEDDAVLEVEARRQALQASGTSARRIACAASLVRCGQPDQALHALSGGAATPEESVVAGMAALKQGDIQAARNALTAVASDDEGLQSLSEGWLAWLSTGLENVGETGPALKASEFRTRCAPATPAPHADLARLLLQAQQPDRAADHAALALALEPESAASRLLLARSLEGARRSVEALPHWEALAAQDPSHLVDLGRCALDAGDSVTALRAAESLAGTSADDAASRLLRGRVLLNQGDLIAARDQLELACHASPSNPEAWIALAECHVRRGDDSAAGETFARATQLAPDNSRLQIALARWLHNQGRHSEALEALERAASAGDLPADALLERGELLATLGHLHKAVEALREAHDRLPGSVRARIALASAYSGLGDAESASALLDPLPEGLTRAESLAAARVASATGPGEASSSLLRQVEVALQLAYSRSPSDPEILYWLGRIYLADRRPMLALETFHSCEAQLRDVNPDLHQAALLGMAAAARDMGDAALAITTLEEARERYPASLPILTGLSEAYLHARLPQQALEVARKAVETRGSDPRALGSLAEAASACEDWPLALDASQRLLDAHPDDLRAWTAFAQIAGRAGEETRARAALAGALWKGRSRPAWLLPLGEHLVRTGHLRSAQDALHRACRLQPDSHLGHRALAKVSQLCGDSAAAHQAWTRVAELEPDQAEPLYHAAKALWSLGRRSPAIGLWQRAVAMEPRNSTLRAELARAYIANDETENGLAEYAAILKANPDRGDLAEEAGMAALRAGAYERAREALLMARAASPDRLEAAMALAECELALGRPDECLRALEAFGGGGMTPPLRAHALRAFAFAEVGDLVQAGASMDAALASTAESEDDLQLVVRSAVRLARWQDALTIVQTERRCQPGRSSQVLIRLELWLRIRMQELGPLFQTADVRTHASAYGAPDEAVRNDIDRVIVELEASGIPAAEAIAERDRAALALGSSDSQTVDRLQARVGTDSSSELAEALAIAEMRSHRPAQAVQWLSPDGRLPTTAIGCTILGLAQSALHDLGEARRAYQAAYEDAVLRPMVSYLVGKSHQDEGRSEEATAAIHAALSGWENEPIWHFRLGSIYHERGSIEAALPHLQRAAELAPDDAAIRILLARALRGDGQLSEAHQAFASALTSPLADGRIWREAAEVALACGEASQAESWFDRACALMPRDPHAFVGAAQAAASLGKQREAIRLGETASALSPNDPEVLTGLAELYARQGKLEKAILTFESALANGGDRLRVTLTKARALVGIGRPAQALTELQAFQEQFQDQDALLAGICEASEAAGDFITALDAASRCVRLSPRSPSYRLALARVCRKAGQLDRAIDELAHLEGLGGARAEALVELGRIHEDRCDPTAALDAYQRAIEVDPTDARPHFRAGMVFKQLKAYVQAGRMLRQAVALNPKDPEALHQLAAVRALELVHGGFHPVAVPS